MTQMFNTTAELAISMGIPIKKLKAEIETYPVIVERKLRKLAM